MFKLDINGIKILQARKCLSMNELSKSANISRSVLSKIMNKTNEATPKVTGLLAKALDVDVTKIIMKVRDDNE